MADTFAAPAARSDLLFSRPPALRPVRPRGWLGPLTTVQIVVFEIAAVLVLAAFGAAGGSPIALACAGVAVVVLLIAVCTPTRSGWWYERQLVRARWRRRRRATRALRPEQIRHPQLAHLAALAPGLSVRAIDDRGSSIGIGQDPHGWFAALAVTVAPDRGGSGLALDRLALLFDEAPIPVTAVAVTSHTIPAPSTLLDHESPARISYLELSATDQIVADQQLLVSVRLGQQAAARAAESRGGGLGGVDRAVATLVNRVSQLLNGPGITVRVLDSGSLIATLAASCPVAVTAQPGAAPGVEAWTAWQSGGLAHSCLQLTRWPQQRSDEFFTALARVPADLVNVTVTLRPAHPDVDVRCLIRMAAEPAALGNAMAEAGALAERAGARLRRLDGRHGPAVWATAPTAGLLQ